MPCHQLFLRAPQRLHFVATQRTGAPTYLGHGRGLEVNSAAAFTPPLSECGVVAKHTAAKTRRSILAKSHAVCVHDAQHFSCFFSHFSCILRIFPFPLAAAFSPFERRVRGSFTRATRHSLKGSYRAENDGACWSMTSTNYLFMLPCAILSREKRYSAQPTHCSFTKNVCDEGNRRQAVHLPRVLSYQVKNMHGHTVRSGITVYMIKQRHSCTAVRLCNSMHQGSCDRAVTLSNRSSTSKEGRRRQGRDGAFKPRLLQSSALARHRRRVAGATRGHLYRVLYCPFEKDQIVQKQIQLQTFRV